MGSTMLHTGDREFGGEGLGLSSEAAERVSERATLPGSELAASQPSARKTVLVGVTGGVAAYKACELVRILQKSGLRVKVVMTEHATHFIDPTTFRSLTRESVGVGLFDNPSDPIHHISLAKEADVFCIAPCTANVIAKVAHGIADDLLTTTLLATTAPVVVAPAMNVNMFQNAVTQENIDTLRQRGFVIVDADDGYLACGDTGKGKLAPVEAVADAVIAALEQNDVEGDAGTTDANAVADLAGKRVVVTAGPTREYIDPVRFLSNPSTGKMGFAVAQAARDRGADVSLVTGPVDLADPEGVNVIRVESAQQMLNAVDSVFDGCDIAVFTAAVSDMRPAVAFDRKLKKGTDDDALQRIELVANPDILKTMAAKKSGAVIVGFAAETDDVSVNALTKLRSKGANLIVANEVCPGNAFGSDDNAALFAYGAPDGPVVEQQPLTSKRALADVILSKALQLA